jgi:hypothetical protein
VGGRQGGFFPVEVGTEYFFYDVTLCYFVLFTVTLCYLVFVSFSNKTTHWIGPCKCHASSSFGFIRSQGLINRINPGLGLQPGNRRRRSRCDEGTGRPSVFNPRPLFLPLGFQPAIGSIYFKDHNNGTNYHFVIFLASFFITYVGGVARVRPQHVGYKLPARIARNPMQVGT